MRLEALYARGDAVRRRSLVRSALVAAAGERVLDIGCGPGFLCAELLQEVGFKGSIVGVDSSTAMLNLAESRCDGHDNVEFRQADATALPVDDSSFDAAVCVQVLEYVADVKAALSEMYRVLRPGGRVVVWDVDWATVSWHSEDRARMAKVLEAWDERLVHPSLPQTLGPALRSAGFEGVVMQAHSFATDKFDPDTYGVGAIPLVRSFVPGHNGVSNEEAKRWAAEQRELGERDEFYFACLQCCFAAARPS